MREARGCEWSAEAGDEPWGYELWYAHTDAYAGKILHVNRGQRLSLQYHEHKDESCYVLCGRVLLIQGPNPEDLKEWELGPGSVWRNLPGEVHTMEAVEDLAPPLTRDLTSVGLTAIRCLPRRLRYSLACRAPGVAGQIPRAPRGLQSGMA